MTTTYDADDACAVCRATSLCTFVSTTIDFGSPDLDLRPPEMSRSSMEYWVQRCTACGYCAPSLSTEIPGAVDTVRSASYQNQLHSAEYPKLANEFLCLALLYEQDGQLANAGRSAVHAAWVCDDAVRIDLLRRAGAFDAALALCEDLLAREKDEMLRRVVLYQRDLIRRHDTGCYTVQQVVDR